MWICECGKENPDGLYMCQSCGYVRTLTDEILDEWEEILKRQAEMNAESNKSNQDETKPKVD